MATAHQTLGAYGEALVARLYPCPKCKRPKTLIRLPPNFKCADLICDFCGFLAQVKASTAKNVEILPGSILGAAWGPQKARMDAAIYFPLYVVLVTTDRATSSTWYLSADLQPPELFRIRVPLSADARKPGWQGFRYDIESARNRFVRLG